MNDLMGAERRTWPIKLGPFSPSSIFDNLFHFILFSNKFNRNLRQSQYIFFYLSLSLHSPFIFQCCFSFCRVLFIFCPRQFYLVIEVLAEGVREQGGKEGGREEGRRFAPFLFDWFILKRVGEFFFFFFFFLLLLSLLPAPPLWCWKCFDSSIVLQLGPIQSATYRSVRGGGGGIPLLWFMLARFEHDPIFQILSNITHSASIFKWFLPQVSFPFPTQINPVISITIQIKTHQL